MKRTLLTILLFLCLYGYSQAQMLQGIMGSGASAAAASPADLLWENFDGSTACGDGSHSNCNNTWSLVGTPTGLNFNVTSGALEGTYSLQVAASDENNEGIVKTFTANNSVNFFFIWHVTTRQTITHIKLLDSSDNMVMFFGDTGPEFQIACGGDSAYAGSVTNGNTYYVWGDYTTNGSTSSCHLHVSADTVKSNASVNLTATGTSTAQASKIALNGAQVSDYIIDKIRVSSSTIGDNPN